MKLKYDFIVREIVGEYVLIPMGESALKISGFLTTNEVGATLMEELKEKRTRKQLLERILEDFDVDEKTASEDIEEFINLLKSRDFIED